MIVGLVIKAVSCGLFTLEERSFRENGTDSHGEGELDLTTQLQRTGGGGKELEVPRGRI